MDTNNNLFDILCNVCDSKGIKITSLCTKVTGSSGNLSTWKKGYMRSDYLNSCADILGVTTDYLLGRESAPIQFKNRDALASLLQKLNDDDIDDLIRYAELLQLKRQHQSEQANL